MMAIAYTENSELRALLRGAIAVVLVWTLLMGASLYFVLAAKHDEILELAQMEAISNINKDISFRYWVASHGGVYVPVSSKTPPNPYLAHVKERDVTTTDGRKLTLMNPAYVMRQTHELHSELYGIRGKITSLKTLNPQNAPDEWETKALNTVGADRMRFSEVQTEAGKPVLRSMVALLVDAGCLHCHAQQGYKVGDIRGGLVTTISLEPYLEREQEASSVMISRHIIVWLLVCLAIFLATRLLLKRTRERIKATAELQDSHKLFKTVTDHAAEWIFWRNPDGSMRYVSPVCEKICGYRADELIAQPELLAKMVYPEDRKIWEEHVREADELHVLKPFEFRIVTRHGKLRWVSNTCRAIYDENGKFIGMRGSNSDVTERRHKDEILMMQSRHAAMGEMVSNIAHQWRQPLTTLGLIAQNLRNDYMDEHLSKEYMDDYAQKSQQLIQEMSTTIDDFRNFFRPNKVAQYFRLSNSVASALNLLDAALTLHGIRTSSDIPEDLIAYGYPNEYSQALLNILANAKDAIAARQHIRGRIEIRGYLEEGHAVLSIVDNGGGMSEATLGMIFEPYFTTKQDGSGIGLYISRIIIERNMGGGISARNVDAGAEFIIRCPVQKVPE